MEVVGSCTYTILIIFAPFECPVDAIKPDTDESAKDWLEINNKYSQLWPNITIRRPEDVPKDNEKWRGVSDKLKHLSERPGKGD